MMIDLASETALETVAAASSAEDCKAFLRNLLENTNYLLSLDAAKHSVQGFIDCRRVFEFRLPLLFPPIQVDESVPAYLNRIKLPSPSYTILLVQSEYAALGSFENGELLRHKTLRTYAVRRQQGRNQLNLGNKSGRGTQGSQLRYRNAIRYLEKVNETLKVWGTADRSERIFYSCPINLWSPLFESKVKSGFERIDCRLQRIPIHVRQANHEELKRINKLLGKGYLMIGERPSYITEVIKLISS